MRRGLWVKLALGGALLALFIFGVRLLPTREWLLAFDQYVRGLGAWAPLAYAAGYAVAGLVIPASLLTLGAGGIFGPWLGTLVVSGGSIVCASIAFLIGRYAARDWVQRKISSFPRFRAVERAVSQQGFRVVLLTRLSPVFPFLYINYAYGVTTVPFWKYALASWLGMIPGIFMYVYLGYAARAGAQVASGGGNGWVTLAKLASFVVPTLIVIVIVGRIAKNALTRAEAPGS